MNKITPVEAIKRLGKDCLVYDWKTSVYDIIKKTCKLALQVSTMYDSCVKDQEQPWEVLS